MAALVTNIRMVIVRSLVYVLWGEIHDMPNHYQHAEPAARKIIGAGAMIISSTAITACRYRGNSYPGTQFVGTASSASDQPPRADNSNSSGMASSRRSLVQSMDRADIADAKLDAIGAA